MPTGFQVGPLYIRFYGIIIMVGVLAAAWLASIEARRRSENPEYVWDGLVWALLGGVIGARIWHLLTPTPTDIAMGKTTYYYFTHPLDAISIWKGGLGIPGAIIGGVVGLYIFSRRKQLNFSMWLDISAPALALGQAIGRWGNYINQELYGLPSKLPWAIHIEPEYRYEEFQNIETYHPLFLYESLWNLVNMFFLLWLGRKYSNKLLPGDVFLVYLITYPVGRFLLEFLRLNPSMVGGINANQTLMLIVASISAGLLIWRHLRRKEGAASTG